MTVPWYVTYEQPNNRTIFKKPLYDILNLFLSIKENLSNTTFSYKKNIKEIRMNFKRWRRSAQVANDKFQKFRIIIELR